MTELELVQQLERFEQDFLFFREQLDNLRKEYSNKYVAIFNKKIIDSDTSIEKLLDRLQQKNIDASKTVLEFVPETEPFLIL